MSLIRRLITVIRGSLVFEVHLRLSCHRCSLNSLIKLDTQTVSYRSIDLPDVYQALFMLQFGQQAIHMRPTP